MGKEKEDKGPAETLDGSTSEEKSSTNEETWSIATSKGKAAKAVGTSRPLQPRLPKVPVNPHVTRQNSKVPANAQVTRQPPANSQVNRQPKVTGNQQKFRQPPNPKASANSTNPQPQVTQQPPNTTENAKVTPQPSKVTVNPQVTQQPSNSSNITANAQVTPKADGDKKKRLSKAEKADRKAMKEADTLQKLYRPKDSHVNLITPELFRKLRGEGTAGPERKQDIIPECSVAKDFPSLDGSVTSPWLQKSFASATSSPTPTKDEGPNSSKEPSNSSPSASEDPQACGSSKAATTPGILRLPATPSSSTPAVVTKMSKTPLLISLDSLIVRKDSKESRALNKQIYKKKNVRTSALIRENVKFTVGNALDSSSPGVIHRGKIRLKPKKPTKLKRCILKSRELRKILTPSAAFEENTSSLEPIKEEEEEEAIKDEEVIKEVPRESFVVPEVNKEKCVVQDTKCKGETIKMIAEINEVETPKKIKEEDKDIKIFREILNNAEKEAKQERKSKAPVADELVEAVKKEMHTRKFRNYCDMFVTKEFHLDAVVPMLRELYRLQDRLYQTDPIKYQTKRRFVNGLKDCLSGLKLNKVQMVLLAPDIEPNNQKGGLDDRVSEIIRLSKEKGVPCIFSGNRFILGKAIMHTKSPVSAIAIFNYQSVEELFNKVVEAAGVLRENYQKAFDDKLEKRMRSEKHMLVSHIEEE